MKDKFGVRRPVSEGVTRRAALKLAATAAVVTGASQLAPPAIISARGEQPIKVGVDEPMTGTYAVTGKNEINGIRLAAKEINAKGGILGRPVELIIEDSTSGDAGVAVQKAHELIDRDKVNFLIGNVNSGLTIAMAVVANQKNVLMIDPGGHANQITGRTCKWNVFQVCPSTGLLVNAIAPTLIKKFGKRFYFLVPDYAFGHSLLRSYERNLKKYGATNLGAELIPLGTADYSANLIKAQAAKPDIIVILQNGEDQVNALKQAVQFGLDKRFHIAGANIELESLEALPPASRIGTWVIEWYWNQPPIPGLKEFVDTTKKEFGGVPTARNWFGHTAMWSCALAANEAKSLDPLKMAKALNGYKLPKEIGLEPHDPFYRENQHLLIGTLYFGTAQEKGSTPDDLFHITDIIDDKTIVDSVEETGCKMTWPASI
ncbi:MAG: ABC transporter substrate-binding protein [Acetobacteraceae bacterium]